MKVNIIQVIIQFSRNNYLEMWTFYARNVFEDAVEYISTIHQFVDVLCQTKFSRDEIMNGGILEY